MQFLENESTWDKLLVAINCAVKSYVTFEIKINKIIINVSIHKILQTSMVEEYLCLFGSNRYMFMI